MTVVNATLVLLAAQGSLHYMESPEFCGQTCHTPMHPQYTAWQNTTHAEVACVQCHIGEGARALVHYKLAGVRQLVHVISGNFPRPIPASQAVMRPALETCGTCHSPTLGHGERTRTIREYAEDETNTETATTLTMHVGGPGQKTASGRAIHWHADPNVRIEYITTDADRQTIPFVRTINEKGETKEYVVEGHDAGGARRGHLAHDGLHRLPQRRRASNSPTAEQAVNRAMAAGQISPALPFVRREAVRLLKSDYSDEAAAVAAIESGFRAVYDASKASVDQAKPGTGHRGDAAPLSHQRVSHHESDVGGLPRQPGPHDVGRVLPLSRAAITWRATARRSVPIARTVTISSSSSNRSEESKPSPQKFRSLHLRATHPDAEAGQSTRT